LHFELRVLRELPALLKLAGPVILAEIGWMVMGIVDTMMVGPLVRRRSARPDSAAVCSPPSRSSAWG
jgi:Na+-driven multidrug efflux pump